MLRDEIFNPEHVMAWLKAAREAKYLLDLMDNGIRSRYLKTSLQQYLDRIYAELSTCQLFVNQMPEIFDDDPRQIEGISCVARARMYTEWTNTDPKLKDL